MSVMGDQENYQKTFRMNSGGSYQRRGYNSNHRLPNGVPVDNKTVDEMATKTIVKENQKVYQGNHVNDTKFTKLQVHKMKDKILAAIAAQRIVIIKGETGCGKTTQIPQFIFDSAREKNEPCNIVVTQPRRIAAITVATRVASERNCPLGTLVGYQIGLDKKGNDDTRILYVTTGVLLQKLIARKNLEEFTHYIIDEIHERNHDMDFLLIVLRHFLNLKSKGEAKLIVMSATINEEKLRQYLITRYGGIVVEPVVIEITHHEQFIVRKFFVDHLKNKIREARALVKFEFDCPEIDENSYTTAARIIQELDNVDRNNVDDDEVLGKRPAVLVFLPGLHEIETMEKVLKEISSPEQNNSFWVRPLHSSITAEEQQAAFMNPPASKRKIILSTNIAESSVTVTDIKYVIDFCLTKSLVTDPTTGCTSLALEWASKSSLIQRAGRVGRIASGRVYRMITSQFYEDEILEEAVPEMVRCPLETLVLKAKLLEMGPPGEVLDLAMDPPDLGNLIQAVAYLKQIGALLIRVDNEYRDDDGDMTLLGEVLAHLPLDVRLGKLIFIGAMFGVPEECIIMACAMATKNIFSTPYGQHLKAYEMKLWWADSTRSDCFAFLNAYKAWRRRKSNHDLKDGQLTTIYYLQPNALKELANLEEEVKRRLKNFHISVFEPILERAKFANNRFQSDDAADDKLFFIKLAIAGAFYPNYFVRTSCGSQDEEKQALNILGGHDPCSTVFVAGLPQNQPTAIYKNVIKKQFGNITERLNVNVDNGSKAYITFHSAISPSKRGNIPGKIEMAVYRAVKMRHVNAELTIPSITHNEATRIYEEYLTKKKCSAAGDVKSGLRIKLNKLVWPWRVDQMKMPKEILEIKISHIESPQRFWVQSSLENSTVTLEQLNVVLNAPKKMNVLIKLPPNADLAIGSLFVASAILSTGTNIFYRCRIVEKKKLHKKRDTAEYTYTVFFIDYGSSRKDLFADEIYDVDPNMKEYFFVDKLPPFAVECSLVKIRPKSRKIDDNPSQNDWPASATDIFRTFESSSSIAKVYSVVNDVLRVKVVLPGLENCQYSWEKTINYKLIEDGYAEKANEDYVSLFKRDEFKKFVSAAENVENIRGHYGEGGDNDERFFASMYCPADNDDDLELPKNLKSVKDTTLKGPYSPLEMDVTSMIREQMGQPARIERDSVNSVLLDIDPSDPKEKMLVAAFVGMNQMKDRLILRHTTMMPNIRALPMLCCLLFAPMVELRVNPSCTRYTGALCGLGYDKRTKKSFSPASDLSVVFDCEITEKELLMINKLRHRLNCVVSPTNRPSAENLSERAQTLRDGLKELFFENTYELQPTYHCTKPFNWGLIKSDRLRRPLKGDGPQHPAEDFDSAYRMIWAVWRTGDADEERENLLRSLKMLIMFSKGDSSRSEIECPLCRVSLTEVPSTKMHLKTAIHRARFKRYREQMAMFLGCRRNDPWNTS